MVEGLLWVCKPSFCVFAHGCVQRINVVLIYDIPQDDQAVLVQSSQHCLQVSRREDACLSLFVGGRDGLRGVCVDTCHRGLVYQVPREEHTTRTLAEVVMKYY